MHADQKTIEWIDSFTKEGQVLKIPKASMNYEIRIFNSPDELDREIQKKASSAQTSLSRIIATYDWEYNSGTKQAGALEIELYRMERRKNLGKHCYNMR